MNNADRLAAIESTKKILAQLEADKVKGIFAVVELREPNENDEDGEGFKFTRKASYALNRGCDAFYQEVMRARVEGN